jgi:tetratricopeptide (TPR) repeat protein
MCTDIDQFDVQAGYLDDILRIMFRIRVLVLVPLVFASLVARAQVGGDLEAQILYAFHVEDANQLTSLVQTLTTQVHENASDNALRYHLAHAEYRLGVLDVLKHARGAKAALENCVDELKPLVMQDVNSVESLTLQSACYWQLAHLEKLEAVLLRAHAETRLSDAYKLAPRNPRVVFFMASDALARAKPGSKDYAQAFAQLELAAKLFEATSATSVEAPGWGHAEAYLEVGRQLEARGDVLGARNWIEKALIVAPDYKAAQRQLATLVAS